MAAERDEAFCAFAVGQAPGLRRLAYGIAGDWHRAEDLVQGALEPAYVHWKRVEAADDPGAYVRAILVRLALSEARRPWRRRERSTTALPEGRAPGAMVEDRLDLAQALAVLTPKQRAVVVLRYLEDRPVADVAALLGISEGTVKRQASDAVRRLRPLLADTTNNEVGGRRVRTDS